MKAKYGDRWEEKTPEQREEVLRANTIHRYKIAALVEQLKQCAYDPLAVFEFDMQDCLLLYNEIQRLIDIEIQHNAEDRG